MMFSPDVVRQVAEEKMARLESDLALARQAVEKMRRALEEIADIPGREFSDPPPVENCRDNHMEGWMDACECIEKLIKAAIPAGETKG